MKPAPIAQNEKERLAALHSYGILDTEQTVEFDDFTRLASEICGTPIALISLIDSDRQWFKSKVGLDVSETPRDISFCGHAIHGTEIFEIPNASEDERFRDNPLVTGNPDIRFYAGAPLITPEGLGIGTICVIDRVPRRLTQAQRNSLKVLGRLLTQQMELKHSLHREQEAHAALTNQSAFLNTLMNSTDVGIISADLNGVIISFNAGAGKISGYTAGDAVGQMTLFDLFKFTTINADQHFQNYDSDSTIQSPLDWLITPQYKGVPEKFECLLKGVHQDSIPVELVISPIYDADKKSTGLLVVAIDVTKRIQAEKEKKRSSDLLAKIANRVPGVVYQFKMEIDGSSNFPYASEAISDIYRVRPEDVVKDATPVFGILHPEDYDGVVASIQKSAQELSIWVHEYRVKFDDGTVNWLLGNAMPEKQTDGSIVWNGFITNINDRKKAENLIFESERQLKNILDNCPTAARITKRGTIKYSYFNSQYLKLTGNTAQSINDFDPSSYYDPHIFSEIQETLSRGESIINKLVELKKPSDPAFGTKWELASYFNIVYENEPATLAWFHDITEQIKLDRMKSEFISTVSHELRTPLTSITGTLSLISNKVFGSLPNQAHQLIEVAHRNSLRLTHMINDLLDMDKLVAGKMVFDLRVHSLFPIIRRSIEDNSNYETDRHVRLVFNEQEYISEVTLVCDEQRFLQVLSNLLSNAIKFSPDGGEVIVDCEFTSPCRDRVKISVSDNGSGIPLEFHQNIFQKFSQADSSDVRQKGGTGLGLAISQQLVKQMGGEIDFTSTYGHGSSFFIVFPITPLD